MTVNEELHKMRKEFIEKHELKCENCELWEKNRKGKCASKTYCIVRDNSFNCAYKEKEKKAVYISPLWETIINRAVFLNEDIIVYPSREEGLPDNFSNVIKFLFGERVTLKEDVVNGYPSLVIRGANFELRNAHTTNANWTCREVKA